MGRKRRKNHSDKSSVVSTGEASVAEEQITAEDSAEGTDQENDMGSAEEMAAAQVLFPAPAGEPAGEEEWHSSSCFSENADDGSEHMQEQAYPDEETMQQSTSVYYEESIEETGAAQAEEIPETAAEESIFTQKSVRKKSGKTKAAKQAKETVKAEEEAGSNESLGSYIREMGAAARLWIRKNRSFCVFTVIALVICLVMIILAGRISKKSADTSDSVSADLAIADKGNTSNAIPIPPDPLAEDALPEVNALITDYFKAMQEGDMETFLSLRSYTDSIEKAKFEAKNEYIDAYENIHCYTKPGPYADSYMVYVTYDLRLKDWSNTAPALVTLVVCRDQEGHLYIYSGGFDENVVDYIRSITSQEDVYALITRIQNEYQSVMDSDASFAEYMAALNQMIKDGVGVRLASAAEEAQAEENVPAGQNEDATSPDTSAGVSAASENAADSGTQTHSFQVKTTAAVNVRMSDSENADRLGKAENGMELTCLEQLQNGWSKVQFEGKTGYIKSDYLVAVGAETATGERAAVIGKAMVTSSVNIRGSADMDGNVLGKAYPGTSFDVIAKDWNGWTTILYNGKTAYIKSEFVDFKAN